MSDRVNRFLKRKSLDISEIKYICRSEQMSVFCMTDGREIATHIPIKEIMGVLPDDTFRNIQKGVVVSLNYILSIEGFVYTMIDGRQFCGRQRSPAEHKRLCREFEIGKKSDHRRFPMSLFEKCSLMEEAPIAFCVIELVFEQDGRGIDFIFRYCNKEMEVIEGVPVSEMINRSFFSVFPNGDKKWIIPYADVALNGTRRTIRDFSPEIGKNLYIRCFQPQQGYCACFLVADENESEAK